MQRVTIGKGADNKPIKPSVLLITVYCCHLLGLIIAITSDPYSFVSRKINHKPCSVTHSSSQVS